MNCFVKVCTEFLQVSQGCIVQVEIHTLINSNGRIWFTGAHKEDILKLVMEKVRTRVLENDLEQDSEIREKHRKSSNDAVHEIVIGETKLGLKFQRNVFKSHSVLSVSANRNENFCIPCKIYKEKLIVYSYLHDPSKESIPPLQNLIGNIFEKTKNCTTNPTKPATLKNTLDGLEIGQNENLFESEYSTMTKNPETPKQGFKISRKVEEGSAHLKRRSKLVKLSRFKFNHKVHHKIQSNYRSPFLKAKSVRLNRSFGKSLSKVKGNVSDDALANDSKSDGDVLMKKSLDLKNDTHLDNSRKLKGVCIDESGESDANSVSNGVPSNYFSNSSDEGILPCKSNKRDKDLNVIPYTEDKNGILFSTLSTDNSCGKGCYDEIITNNLSRKRELPEDEFLAISKRLCMIKTFTNQGTNDSAALTNRKDSEAQNDSDVVKRCRQKSGSADDHPVCKTNIALNESMEGIKDGQQRHKFKESQHRNSSTSVDIPQNCASDIFKSELPDDFIRKDLSEQNNLTADEKNWEPLGIAVDVKHNSTENVNQQKFRCLARKKNSLKILSAVDEQLACILFQNVESNNASSFSTTSEPTKSSLFVFDGKSEENDKNCDKPTENKLFDSVTSCQDITSSSLSLTKDENADVDSCHVLESPLLRSSPLLNHVDAVIVVSDDEGDIDAEIKTIRSVQALNEVHLRHLVHSNENYLRKIFQGKTNCRRHEDYKAGGVVRRALSWNLPVGAFSYVQYNHILCCLKEIFCKKHQKYLEYVMMVLLPEMIVKIFMLIYDLNYEQAESKVKENAKNVLENSCVKC